MDRDAAGDTEPEHEHDGRSITRPTNTSRVDLVAAALALAACAVSTTLAMVFVSPLLDAFFEHMRSLVR